jgi:hypothetical protein
MLLGVLCINGLSIEHVRSSAGSADQRPVWAGGVLIVGGDRWSDVLPGYATHQYIGTRLVAARRGTSPSPRRPTGVRCIIGLSVALVMLAAGCGGGPAPEGATVCNGIIRSNRCVQFPPSPRIAELVAAMPVPRKDEPLTHVVCYATGTLALCNARLRNGSLGVEHVRFRVHPDGSATPICPAGAGKHAVSLFCIN